MKHRVSSQQKSTRKALRQPHAANPCTITVDKNPAYPRVVRDLKQAGHLRRFSRLRPREYLNNIVEQDHRRIKRLVRPDMGFGSLRTASKRWRATRRWR
ncbi:MAG: DDE-type integrase/transposase/recombinase [Janthinobacterium lividum]